MNDQLLKVDDLRTYFHLKKGVLKAVDGISFSMNRGEILCIVGESGSGKSVSAMSIMGLIDPPGRRESGTIIFEDLVLNDLDERSMRTVRGNKIAMIFQDPMRSLNPGFTIGDQISEALIIHRALNKGQARTRVIELLDMVGIAEPDRRYTDYPHQFSGGMRQRVMIAMAISCQPDLLIADEPTTALDVTIQAQIINLLKDLCQELNSAMILITHDIGLVAEIAQDVMVMYAGKAVEYGDVRTVLKHSQHPYTRDLMRSLIRIEDDKSSALTPIKGSPPDLINLPGGCSYQPRCELVNNDCRVTVPELRTRTGAHKVACHVVTDSRT
tara:strand:+ start:6105 stop:7085 length:981 start_codon:yes stop_codon:yes gene_type:complete